MSDDNQEDKQIAFSLFDGANQDYSSRHEGWTRVHREVECTLGDGEKLFQKERDTHPKQKPGSGISATIYDPELDEEDIDHRRRRIAQAREIHGVTLDVESVYPAEPDADVEDVPSVPWPDEVMEALPAASWVWSSFNHGMHVWDEDGDRDEKLLKSSPEHPRYHVVLWLKEPLVRGEDESAESFRKRYADLRTYITDWLDSEIDTSHWHDTGAKDVSRLLWGSRPRQEGAQQKPFFDVYDDLPLLDVEDLPGGASLSELVEKREQREAREERERRERLWRMREGDLSEPSSTRQQRYAEAAIDGIADEMQRAQQGGRHDAIVRAGLQAGSFVEAGMITQLEVEQRLLPVAEAILPDARSRSGEPAEALQWGMERADAFDVSTLSDDYQKSSSSQLERGEDLLPNSAAGDITFGSDGAKTDDKDSETDDDAVTVDVEHPYTLVLEGVCMGASLRILRWLGAQGVPPVLVGSVDDETTVAVWGADSAAADEEAEVERYGVIKSRIKDQLRYLLEQDDDVPASDYISDGEMMLSVHPVGGTPRWSDDRRIVIDHRDNPELIDFESQAEVTDFTVDTPSGDTWRWGSWCAREWVEETDKGKPEEEVEPIGEDCWPVCKARDIDLDDRFVRIRAIDDTGRDRYHQIPMTELSSSRLTEEIKSVAQHIQIEPGHTKSWLEGLNHWRLNTDGDERTLTRRQGWRPDQMGSPSILAAAGVSGVIGSDTARMQSGVTPRPARWRAGGTGAKSTCPRRCSNSLSVPVSLGHFLNHYPDRRSSSTCSGAAPAGNRPLRRQGFHRGVSRRQASTSRPGGTPTTRSRASLAPGVGPASC